VIENRPTGLRRLFFRAPVYLYRAGLGALLGRRFLYLVHTGRVSGRRRDVVLEVVRFDDTVPEVFVVAAWGRRADWLRNIEVAPAIEVRVGRDRWSRPRHRFLDEAEMTGLLRDYQRRHPRAWATLAPRMGLDPHSPDAGIGAAVQAFPAVAFRPRS
jgi:deazaflavin-dependent oxidoreductase (nitroreductase family)